MIEIIYGDPTFYVTSCVVCKCKFRFGKWDARVTTYRTGVDEWETNYSICCPQCGDRISLGNEKQLEQIKEGDNNEEHLETHSRIIQENRGLDKVCTINHKRS